MEQEGEGRGEKRRSQLAAQQPQQHHRCPRCDSLNTKFCYFNNYSLSQPRHFCKACKRYWTQGGTFRNIPVGGSSRKTKRARTCSSLSSNNSHPQQPQSNFTSSSQSTVVHSTTPYYQLLSPNPSQLLKHESLKTVTDSSNSPLLSGFNAASFPPRFYEMGNRDRVNSVYSAEQGIPSSMGNNSTASSSRSNHWPQSLINNATNDRASSGASLWSTINATSVNGNSGQNNIGGGSSSFNPNDWQDLLRYGPPQ
ncbi:hypothetical protein VNO77_04948 [Canavalia gladiata]|uniref:Dof zinc finger protein n=1 Tax=Canavalia gladiata TaxID=3824 RepID=A0AAN9R9J1_CANGL